MAITMEDAKKSLHFRRGDSINIGKFTGTVVELDSRRAVIETADGRVEVQLGQNLGEATKSKGRNLRSRALRGTKPTTRPGESDDELGRADARRESEASRDSVDDIGLRVVES